jgi:hydrogenase-4 component B
VFIGLLTSITGALYAAIDSDFKRLLAYSSIENLGIIASVLGLAVVMSALHSAALTQLALVALLVHTISHGVFKSLLFLAAGNVAEAAHTTDLEHLGGLRRVLPLTAPLLLIGCGAAAASPPLTGFASEWLVFTSFVRALPAAPPALAALIVIAIGNLAATSGLAALAFVKLRDRVLGRAAHDSRDPDRASRSLVDRARLARLFLHRLRVGAHGSLPPNDRCRKRAERLERV